MLGRWSWPGRVESAEDWQQVGMAKNAMTKRLVRIRRRAATTMGGAARTTAVGATVSARSSD
jgi:hypothetical protein